MTKFELLIVAGIILLVIGFSLAYGFNLHNGHTYEDNMTNITDTIMFGDNWQCGYINTTTTLNELMDCFRD